MMLAWYLADVGLVDQAQDILDAYPEPVPHSWYVSTPWGMFYTGP